MSIITDYPVNTLSGEELLPAGAYVPERIGDALEVRVPFQEKSHIAILENTSIANDFLHYISSDPYHRIFSEQNKALKLLRNVADISIPVQTLESIDYFKTHDAYTYRHIVLVFFLTKLLADDLVENKRLRRQEVSSGPLHDIGKICVPLSVLKKTSPLTRTERGLLEHHTVAGYVLLSYYYRDYNHLAAQIARDHHERKDGSGYPRGMLMEDPLVEIVAVADIYDALISPRPYRPKSYENRAALEELTAMADRGTLNPRVVKALIAHNRKSKPHFTECIISKEKRAQPPKKNFYGTTMD